MKKLVFSLALVGVFLLMSSAALAANLGVVLVGGTDYKDAHFTDEMIALAKESFNPTVSLAIGTDEQARYQNFWTQKGHLEEGELTPAIIQEYARFSGHDKVLFLVVKDPVVDEKQLKTPLFTLDLKHRVTVEVKGYLADREQIINGISAVNEDSSRISQLRARLGAFKKSVQFIYGKVSPQL